MGMLILYFQVWVMEWCSSLVSSVSTTMSSSHGPSIISSSHFLRPYHGAHVTMNGTQRCVLLIAIEISP